MSPDPEVLKRSQYFTPPNTEHPHSSRTHYFDWEDIIAPLARMHQAHFHDWGIASGLAVSLAADGTGVEVEPGVAVDGKGELIALAATGQADISLSQPGEAGQQIVAPFRLSTADLAGQTRYLTIQFAERLRFGEGAGGKLEQTPWLRLRPTTGLDSYLDDGSAIILAVVAVDATGVATVRERANGLSHSRRLVGSTIETLHVQRATTVAGRVQATLAARIEPIIEGGLQIMVPEASDVMRLGHQGGGNFSALEVRANDLHAQGNLHVQGSLQLQADLQAQGTLQTQGNLQVAGATTLLGDVSVGGATGARLEVNGSLQVQAELRVNGVAAFTRSVGIGTAQPNRSLTIAGATESYLNLRTQAGAAELLLGVDANGGVLATASAHDLHLHTAGNNPQLTLKVNGNVGIGTTSPNKQLAVAGEIELDYAGIHFGGIRGDYRYGISVNVADALVYESAEYHRWHRQNAELMTLTPDGRLGLGTTAPLHLLSVAGGPSWTSNRWGGAIELANASAIAWRANAANQRSGLGHTNTGFYIFRTASEPGTTGSPAIYDLVIDNGGNVGIGAPEPSFRLDVRGQERGWIGSGDSSQTVGGWRLGRWPEYNTANTWVYLSRADRFAYQDLAVGALWAGGALRFGTADDLAEMTPVCAADQLEPGDVVMIAEPTDDRVLLTKSNRGYEPKVAGVISDPTQAGLIIGGSHPTDVDRADLKPIALAGRVLTKVTTENGPIKAGDRLTSAATAGYAMKATAPGWILGKALQSLAGGPNGVAQGKIWVHVSLGWCGADDE